MEDSHGGRCLWLVWAVLAAGLTLTVLATLYIERDVRSQHRRELALIGDEIAARINTRLHAHAQVLRSGAAFFAGSEEVTRDEWREFIARSQVHRNLPGIQGVGFAQRIPAEQLDAHLDAIRAQGFPDYQVWPQGERDPYTAIIYLEPFAGRNLRAFGYDMFAEPVRRAAMERARDENLAVLSGKVLLVQETARDIQAGALMYVPVYRADLPIDTLAQRRAALLGWVYSPYRMNDLMAGIVGDWNRHGGRDVHLLIHDGERIAPETLLYDNGLDSSRAAHAEAPDVQHRVIDFNGQRWTLSLSRPGLQTGFLDDTLVWLAAGIGIFISLLLAALVFALIEVRTRARQLAVGLAARQHAEQALRESEHNYRTLVDNLQVGLVVHGPDTGILFSNPMASDLLGLTPEQMQGIAAIDPVWSFLREDGTRMPLDEYPVNRAMVSGSGQRNLIVGLLRPDCAEPIWVQCEAHPQHDGQSQIQRVVVTFFDVTARKRAQTELLARESLLRATVDNVPFEFWARDREGRCFMENPPLVAHWGSILWQLPEEADTTPEELAIWQSNNRRALAGEIVDEEVVYVIDGEPRLFQNIIVPIRVDDEIHGIQGRGGRDPSAAHHRRHPGSVQDRV